MNKSGKSKHSYWTEGGFVQKRNNTEKLIAQCKVCNKILQNTAINRLRNHRKKCCYESNLDTPNDSDDDHTDNDIHNNYKSGLDDYEAPLRKEKILPEDDR
ncbi:uncharacterized protein LOC109503985 [Harpegnathos saltator]|uniref:uncharacterized protein LOC109503985 n=1 Tax=Harpegnathos saltator TaxID=610380 RepID=UPI000DBEE6C1|nr:uncharacterized protein LOC109503985 [Harpegnathos saltator]